jgi:hypothetical protein
MWKNLPEQVIHRGLHMNPVQILNVIRRIVFAFGATSLGYVRTSEKRSQMGTNWTTLLLNEPLRSRGASLSRRPFVFHSMPF